jgi:hypothetical protein
LLDFRPVVSIMAAELGRVTPAEQDLEKPERIAPRVYEVTEGNEAVESLQLVAGMAGQQGVARRLIEPSSTHQRAGDHHAERRPAVRTGFDFWYP